MASHLPTTFLIWKSLTESSSCCSQLTFIPFSCWLFFQLSKSERLFASLHTMWLCILLGCKPCWHSCWLCFIQLFPSHTCTKAVFIFHLSFRCHINLDFSELCLLYDPLTQSWQVSAAFVLGICLLSSSKLSWRFWSRWHLSYVFKISSGFSQETWTDMTAHPTQR